MVHQEVLGQYVVSCATCADKIHHGSASDTVTWTAAKRRVQDFRRCGVSSSNVRNQWQQRSGFHHLARQIIRSPFCPLYPAERQSLVDGFLQIPWNVFMDSRMFWFLGKTIPADKHQNPETGISL
jgi:Zn-finger protein